MISVNKKTPFFYSICLAVFIFLSINELTKVKKLTRFEAWNSCLWDELQLEKWKKAPKNETFSNSTAELLAKCSLILPLSPIKLSNSKLHIFLENLTVESVHVSIGIENGGEAEEQLKELLPNTDIFATNIHQNGQNSSSRDIGTVLPLAIGFESGLVESADLGLDVDEFIAKIDIIYFLRNILKRDFFDSIWISLKTSEFPIMRVVEKFNQSGITACQINFKVEMSTKNDEEFREFFLELVANRQYAMFVEPMDEGLGVLLVNLGSSKCQELQEPRQNNV